MRFMFLATKDNKCYRLINLNNVVEVIPHEENPDKTWITTTAGYKAEINESFENFTELIKKYISDTYYFDNKITAERQRATQAEFLKEFIDTMKKW